MLPEHHEALRHLCRVELRGDVQSAAVDDVLHVFAIARATAVEFLRDAGCTDEEVDQVIVAAFNIDRRASRVSH